MPILGGVRLAWQQRGYSSEEGWLEERYGAAYRRHQVAVRRLFRCSGSSGGAIRREHFGQYAHTLQDPLPLLSFDDHRRDVNKNRLASPCRKVA